MKFVNIKHFDRISFIKGNQRLKRQVIKYLNRAIDLYNDEIEEFSKLCNEESYTILMKKLSLPCHNDVLSTIWNMFSIWKSFDSLNFVKFFICLYIACINSNNNSQIPSALFATLHLISPPIVISWYSKWIDQIKVILESEEKWALEILYIINPPVSLLHVCPVLHGIVIENCTKKKQKCMMSFIRYLSSPFFQKENGVMYCFIPLFKMDLLEEHMVLLHRLFQDCNANNGMILNALGSLFIAEVNFKTEMMTIRGY